MLFACRAGLATAGRRRTRRLFEDAFELDGRLDHAPFGRRALHDFADALGPIRVGRCESADRNRPLRPLATERACAHAAAPDGAGTDRPGKFDYGQQRERRCDQQLSVSVWPAVCRWGDRRGAAGADQRHAAQDPGRRQEPLCRRLGRIRGPRRGDPEPPGRRLVDPDLSEPDREQQRAADPSADARSELYISTRR